MKRQANKNILLKQFSTEVSSEESSEERKFNMLCSGKPCYRLNFVTQVMGYSAPCWNKQVTMVLWVFVFKKHRNKCNILVWITDQETFILVLQWWLFSLITWGRWNKHRNSHKTIHKEDYHNMLSNFY